MPLLDVVADSRSPASRRHLVLCHHASESVGLQRLIGLFSCSTLAQLADRTRLLLPWLLQAHKHSHIRLLDCFYGNFAYDLGFSFIIAPSLRRLGCSIAAGDDLKSTSRSLANLIVTREPQALDDALVQVVTPSFFQGMKTTMQANAQFCNLSRIKLRYSYFTR